MKIYKHKEVEDIPVTDIVAAARGNKQLPDNIEVKSTIVDGEEIIIASPQEKSHYVLIYDSRE